jgi:hypothetical protein
MIEEKDRLATLVANPLSLILDGLTCIVAPGLVSSMALVTYPLWQSIALEIAIFASLVVLLFALAVVYVASKNPLLKGLFLWRSLCCLLGIAMGVTYAP